VAEADAGHHRAAPQLHHAEIVEGSEDAGPARTRSAPNTRTHRHFFSLDGDRRRESGRDATAPTGLATPTASASAVVPIDDIPQELRDGTGLRRSAASNRTAVGGVCAISLGWVLEPGAEMPGRPAGGAMGGRR
jgi:hypothetical protein